MLRPGQPKWLLERTASFSSLSFSLSLSLATPLSLLSTFLLRPCSAAGIQALLRIVATRNRPSSSNFFSPELAKGSLYLGGPAAIRGPGYVMRRRLRDGDSSSARPNLPLFPFLNTAFPKAAPLSPVPFPPFPFSFSQAATLSLSAQFRAPRNLPIRRSNRNGPPLLEITPAPDSRFSV